MRVAILMALLLVMAPAAGFGETISNPTIGGRAVDHCMAINGAADCHRDLMVAAAVCADRGLRHVVAYRLRQRRMMAVRLDLTVTDREVVTKSEWSPIPNATTYDSIECAR